jgi:hypothetical protein
MEGLILSILLRRAAACVYSRSSCWEIKKLSPRSKKESNPHSSLCSSAAFLSPRAKNLAFWIACINSKFTHQFVCYWKLMVNNLKTLFHSLDWPTPFIPWNSINSLVPYLCLHELNSWKWRSVQKVSFGVWCSWLQRSLEIILKLQLRWVL